MDITTVQVPASESDVALVFDLARLPRGLQDASGKVEARVSELGNVFVTSPRTAKWEARLDGDEGLRPALVKLLRLDEKGEPLSALLPVAGQCLDDAHGYATSSSPEALVVISSYLKYHEAVQTVIAGMVGPRKRYCSYFAEVNLNTHIRLLFAKISDYDRPFFGTSNDFKFVISAIKDHLKRQIRTRAIRFVEDRTIGPIEHLPEESASEATRPMALELSRMLAAIADRHSMDQADLEGAFEMFANGELRTQLPDSSWAFQPSSAYYYLLGEFALLCMAELIHPTFWKSIARALVRTQRIYTRVYAVKDPRVAEFGDYGPCAFRGEKQFSSCEKRALATQYMSASDDYLPLLAAANFIECLGGELS